MTAAEPGNAVDAADAVGAASDAASDASLEGVPGIRGRIRASPRWRRFRELNNDGAAFLSKGDAERARGCLEAAYRETLIDGAETDGEAMDARARVLGNLAVLRENAGDLDGALATIGEAISAADTTETLIGDERGTRAVQVSALIARAQTLDLAGRSDDALRDTEHALTLIDGAHDESRAMLRFSAHNTRAGILVLAARFEEAQAEAQVAREVAEASFPQHAAYTYMTLASIAERTGDEVAFAGYLALAHELNQITGDPAGLQLAIENIARRALREGRHDEAETQFAEAERIAASAGLGIRLAACRFGLAGVALARGNTRRAHQLLASAITDFERSGARQQLIECHELAGTIHAIERRFRHADKEYLRARALCEAGFERARIDVRRAEALVEWSPLVLTGAKRASLLRDALDLAAPAALATDAMRHRFAPGPVRERWTSTVVAPSMNLAFQIATQLLDTPAIISLVENASASISLQSDRAARTSHDAAEQAVAAALAPDAGITELFGPRGFSGLARRAEPDAELPAAASAIFEDSPDAGRGTGAGAATRFALPPQLDIGLDVATPLDSWVAAAEERYGIAVRDRTRVATW